MSTSTQTIAPANSNSDFKFAHSRRAAQKYRECIRTLADVGETFDVLDYEGSEPGEDESTNFRRVELVPRGDFEVSVRHQRRKGQVEHRKGRYRIFGMVDESSREPWTSSSTHIPGPSSRSSRRFLPRKYSSAPYYKRTLTLTTPFEHSGLLDHTLPYQNRDRSAGQPYQVVLPNHLTSEQRPETFLGYYDGWDKWDCSAFQGTIGGRFTENPADPEAQSTLNEEEVTMDISIGFFLLPPRSQVDSHGVNHSVIAEAGEDFGYETSDGEKEEVIKALAYDSEYDSEATLVGEEF